MAIQDQRAMNTTAAGFPSAAKIEINRVLRNTYTLLSMTLIFSAAMAGVAMVTQVPPMSPFLVIAVYFGLLFLTNATRNSVAGIFSVFALTGWLGFTLGPLLSLFIQAGAGDLVMLALGGTGVIFFALSGIALVTKKDFSFLTKFIFTGLLVAFIAVIANLFLEIPGLHLALSAIFILLSSGLILWQTSSIINGGERNYIMATVTLYVSLYNIFVSLLNLLSAFSND